jgi:hypothetical protein
MSSFLNSDLIRVFISGPYAFSSIALLANNFD